MDFWLWFENTQMYPIIWIFGGGIDKNLDIEGCCNVAHAKRTLHTKYLSNTSKAMLNSLPKTKIDDNIFIKKY